MKITILLSGQEKELDVPEGKTIAHAASEEGIHLLGSCGGFNACAQCLRHVRSGMKHLLNKNGTPYQHPVGAASYVRTCQVTVAGDGVSIDADRRARANF